MRWFLMRKDKHLNKINNISKDMLINTRFLRNNSMDVIHQNNKMELIKKCYSTLINPKFKENYYDIITEVLPEKEIKSISSSCKDSFIKKINCEYSFMENILKKEKLLHNKKSEILSIINKKVKENKKNNFIKSNSSKNILSSKAISFFLNQHSFLNQFENLKKKCNNINNNKSLNVLHSISLKDKNLSFPFKKKKLKNNEFYSKDYSSFFKDPFYHEKNDLQSQLSSHQKVYAGVFKFKKKIEFI